MSAVTNKKDFMTVEHINAQSLLEGMDEILLLTKYRNIDILCVSESWLLPDIPDVNIQVIRSSDVIVDVEAVFVSMQRMSYHLTSLT